MRTSFAFEVEVVPSMKQCGSGEDAAPDHLFDLDFQFVGTE